MGTIWTIALSIVGWWWLVSTVFLFIENYHFLSQLRRAGIPISKKWEKVYWYPGYLYLNWKKNPLIDLTELTPLRWAYRKKVQLNALLAMISFIILVSAYLILK